MEESRVCSQRSQLDIYFLKIISYLRSLMNTPPLNSVIYPTHSLVAFLQFEVAYLLVDFLPFLPD